MPLSVVGPPAPSESAGGARMGKGFTILHAADQRLMTLESETHVTTLGRFVLQKHIRSMHMHTSIRLRTGSG
jgi:hypothetical protein